MLKYAICLTKDNNRTILQTHEKEVDAMAAGEQLRKRYSRDKGLLSCILADFDTNNVMQGQSYRLFHSWI